ncbi:MAG TPA: hypothetical protein VEL51_00970 [Vicinamibacterales bacterium]|nr:hypothetical protein [Vicinamibacterales bacterium]
MTSGQRWRIGAQRELTKTMMAEVAYLGSYSDDISLTQRLDYLPEQYWADGLVRNDAIANALNATVPNPFNIRNFEFLRTQNPVLYQDMATNGFFTATTRSVASLLRAYPHMNGVNNTRVPSAESKYA